MGFAEGAEPTMAGSDTAICYLTEKGLFVEDQSLVWAPPCAAASLGQRLNVFQMKPPLLHVLHEANVRSKYEDQMRLIIC